MLSGDRQKPASRLGRGPQPGSAVRAKACLQLRTARVRRAESRTCRRDSLREKSQQARLPRPRAAWAAGGARWLRRDQQAAAGEGPGLPSGQRPTLSPRAPFRERTRHQRHLLSVREATGRVRWPGGTPRVPGQLQLLGARLSVWGGWGDTGCARVGVGATEESAAEWVGLQPGPAGARLYNGAHIRHRKARGDGGSRGGSGFPQEQCRAGRSCSGVLCPPTPLGSRPQHLPGIPTPRSHIQTTGPPG